MKIIQVVTYHSKDGAFGGPTRVAEAQCKALAKLGHEVVLLAASPVEHVQKKDVDGYTLILAPAKRLHKSLGFAGVYAPNLNRELKRELSNADVAHIHLARDLVTLPAARAVIRSRVPLFLQTHGMVDKSQKLLSKPLDLLWTLPVIKRAKLVLTLTDQEDSDIAGLVSDAKIERINNGVEVKPLPAYANRPNKVVFLSRLQQRKRPVAFVEMARALAVTHPQLTFEIAGSDEGELEVILQTIERLQLGDRVRVLGGIEPSQTDAFLEEAKVMVLPSFGEIFPMVLLEAFRAGTPAVVTDSLGIVGDCIKFGLAEVTSGDPLEMAKAVSRILDDQKIAEGLRQRSLTFLEKNLNIEDVARQLELSYKSWAQD